MDDRFKKIRERVDDALKAAGDASALEALRLSMLGKKGEITGLLKSLGTLPPEERRSFGQTVNDLRGYVEAKLEEAKEDVKARHQSHALLAEKIDPTLPGKRRPLGHTHPMTATTEKMAAFFIGMGFTIAEGPHIETDYYNFAALNIPKEHPARDEQDTFYVAENIVLRTQTSPVQVRTMEKMKPPIRIIAPGKAFRSDAIDATHTPAFHQMEGMVIDKGINLGDLKGIVEEYSRYMFGEGTKIRLRPSYFPFTEPSAEVDATCHACKGNVPAEGCRVCKDSGWVELGGCGMIHPDVLRMSGIDPDVYSGYAFGLGIDRTASTAYGISDPRHYFENSMQFLSQF